MIWTPDWLRNDGSEASHRFYHFLLLPVVTML